MQLIIAANHQGGDHMSPLFLNLGNNRRQQQPPTINQALPPIIEKNVDRDPNNPPSQLTTPTYLGVGEGFKPYQPKFANIQNTIPVAQPVADLNSLNSKKKG
jgi:hypothetical protein